MSAVAKRKAGLPTDYNPEKGLKKLAVAEAAGYPVGTVTGSDHHVQNRDLIGDGRILDPEYPESLIYAEGMHGPVLIGVMFEMDGLGDSGPMVPGRSSCGMVTTMSVLVCSRWALRASSHRSEVAPSGRSTSR